MDAFETTAKTKGKPNIGLKLPRTIFYIEENIIHDLLTCKCTIENKILTVPAPADHFVFHALL